QVSWDLYACRRAEHEDRRLSFGDEERHDPRVGVAVALRKVGSGDEERGRERVRLCGRAGDDRGAQDALGRPSRARVDHVSVAAALHLEELLAGAARTETPL